MKKKKLKKISKYIFDSIENKNSLKKSSLKKKFSAPTPIDSGEEQKWCDYDLDVSIKFTKIFNILMKYPDNLNIDYGENHIHIQTESIKSIKKSSTINNTQYTKKSEEDFLRIEVSRTGFLLNYGYQKVSRYKDENMFKTIIDDVQKKVREINANNFNDIWDKISKESGLIRDSNLDEIFSELE
jgi:hypothetical protein